MYKRTAGFAGAVKQDHAPKVILGLRTPGGRRLYAKHSPTLTETGFKSAVLADGAWPADGSCTAGVNSEPILTRRRDLVKVGQISESLSTRRGEVMGLFSGGRTSDLVLTMNNAVDEAGKRHFSQLTSPSGEGLIGSAAEVAVNYPGLEAKDALQRFSGRVRRVEITAETVTLRLRAV